MRPGYANHDYFDDTPTAKIIACLDVKPIAPEGRLANADLKALNDRLEAIGEKLQDLIVSCPRRRTEDVRSYLEHTFLDLDSPQARDRAPLLERLKLAKAQVLWRTAKDKEDARLAAEAAAAARDREIERLRALANPDVAEIERNLSIVAKAARAERILADLPDLIADHRSAARARAALNRTFVEMEDARRRLGDEALPGAPARPEIPEPPAELRDRLQVAAREIVRL